MDINCTRHNVNNEETVLCEAVEVPIEGTVVVYDNGKKIKKLIKTCFKSSVTSKTLMDRSVRLDGTVIVCLIYIDENNCLGSYNHILPFTKTVETSNELTDGKIFTEITDDKITASYIAENKINIGGAVCIKVCVKKMTEQHFICDIDDSGIEQLKGESEITVMRGFAEKSFIAEEEISIGNSQPSVGCVIRHNATAIIDEVKIINNKVMVKGRCKIYVLYLPEEGTRPQSFEEGFPFSQLIDVDGINDSCRCDSSAEVIFCELSPRNTLTDEIRSFSVSLKILLSVKAYCDDSVPVLFDAYSVAGNYKAVKKEMCFTKIKANISDKFIARKALEFTDGAIGSVIDVWCDVKGHSSRFENGVLRITGTVMINVLAYDTEGVANCFERLTDFEYTYEAGEGFSNPQVSFGVNVEHCSYTITGANTLDVSAEILVGGAIYENKKHLLLTDLVENEEQGKKHSSGSIVLYFANKGERVWDIAKKYNSSVREIKELNGVNEEIFTSSAKIIIPTK